MYIYVISRMIMKYQFYDNCYFDVTFIESYKCVVTPISIDDITRELPIYIAPNKYSGWLDGVCSALSETANTIPYFFQNSHASHFDNILTITVIPG